MGTWTPREPRTSVLLQAQLNCGEGWGRATICDVSARGVSLRSVDAPARGQFVELRHGDVSIVGQVRWSSGGRCGVMTRDRISLSALLGADTPIREALRTPIMGHGRALRAERSVEEVASRARVLGLALEWATVVAIGVLAAGAIAATMQAALDPLEQAGAALTAPG